MSFARSLFTGIKDWYNEINGATLTGAIDVIVVEQEDGSYKSSPFHVRFGKLGVLKAKEKIVDLEVNGESVDIHMKLDDNGAAFFVEGLEEGEAEDPILATSPLPNLSSQDATPSWPTDAERESVNRSLNFGTDPDEADKSAEDVLDEMSTTPSAIAGVLKSKNNKSKRKRKTKKHSRSASKSSLKEIIAVQASTTDENTPTAAPSTPAATSMPPPSSLPTPTMTSRTEAVVSSTPMSVTEPSLLLSRLPNDESLSSFLVDSEEPIENSDVNEENSSKMSVSGSLPINIEKPQYFSEPEISPGTSPMGSRPPSPILSDSEYETRGHRGSITKKETAAEQSWEWGQLPTSTTTPQHSKEAKTEKSGLEGASKESVEKSGSGSGIISYLFGGQSKNKKPEDEAPGMYLDDLIEKQNDDEEVRRIYLGSRSRNETISGNDNEDTESGTGTSLPMSPHSTSPLAIGYPEDWALHAEISLCGGLGNDFSPALFEQSKMSFDDFASRIEEFPDLLSDPGLVVKLNDSYLKWETAAPLIMSHVMYGRSLPSDLVEKLKGKKKLPTTSAVASVTSVSENQKKSSWWPFSSRQEKETSEAAIADDANKPNEEAAKEAISLDTDITPTNDNVTEIAPIDRKRRSDHSSSSEGEMDMIMKSYKKTLRLNSDLIKLLKLKRGANEIQFSVTTAYQGTTRCYCHVYLWNYSDKIVISDIDGTITKSDVLGHVLPIIGRDWAQSGVASLFTKIVNNGYHIVYLSARAIGQASITKDYLASIKQGEVNLPDGPIFLNPTSLVNAFHREVIIKKPEEFKIACMTDIKRLFPETKNPFYAGYGNRVNDVWAYQAVGIPMSRIFTINPKGELRHELTNAFQTSYGSMTDIADHIFPPTDANSSPSMNLEYSSFTYWRDPLPAVVDMKQKSDEKTTENNAKKPEDEAAGHATSSGTSHATSQNTTTSTTVSEEGQEGGKTL